MSNPNAFVVKGEQKEIKFNSQSKTSLENSDEDDQEALSSTDHELDLERDHDDQEEDVVDNKEEKHHETKIVAKLESPTAPTEVSEEAKELEEEPPRLGQSEVMDDDEGFKTPTSSEFKIPVMTECPPAPRKPRPQPPRNRRASSGIHISLHVFDNMFPLTSQDGDHDHDHDHHISPKIKKARIDGSE